MNSKKLNGDRMDLGRLEATDDNWVLVRISADGLLAVLWSSRQ